MKRSIRTYNGLRRLINVKFEKQKIRVDYFSIFYLTDLMDFVMQNPNFKFRVYRVLLLASLPDIIRQNFY